MASVVLPIPDPQAVIDGIKMFTKEVSEVPSSAVQFTANDLLTYATDVGSVGASREDKEYDFFHLKDTAKLPGKSTINDLSITEALTSDQLATRKEQYKNKKFIVVCFFEDDGTLQYGCYGYIKSWEGTFSNKENNTVQWTLALSSDEVEGTFPTA